MKPGQLSLFGSSTIKKTSSPKKNIVTVAIDGAARGNPGPAGAGIVIKNNQEVLGAYGFYLGKKTNNQAEYAALLFALAILHKKRDAWDIEGAAIVIQSDSQLLVKQIQGYYKVKNEELKNLHSVAQKLMPDFSCSIKHVLRESNQEADEQANKGVDSKTKVPQALLNLLSDYGAILSLIS